MKNILISYWREKTSNQIVFDYWREKHCLIKRAFLVYWSYHRLHHCETIHPLIVVWANERNISGEKKIRRFACAFRRHLEKGAQTHQTKVLHICAALRVEIYPNRNFLIGILSLLSWNSLQVAPWACISFGFVYPERENHRPAQHLSQHKYIDSCANSSFSFAKKNRIFRLDLRLSTSLSESNRFSKKIIWNWEKM